MTSRQKHPDSKRSLRARPIASARLMLVDSDPDRVLLTRQWIGWEGGPDAEVAAGGDEALDLLGASAQRYDIVAAWPTLADDANVDFFGVLRRCRSPVRLLAVTALTPGELGRPGRLAGVATVDDSGQPAGLLRALEATLAGGDTVEAIVTRKRAPASLSSEWANAIYGAPPGGRFHAALD
jgi:hypothetical protein